jgi:hypothetical protein
MMLAGSRHTVMKCLVGHVRLIEKYNCPMKAQVLRKVATAEPRETFPSVVPRYRIG